DDQTRQIARLGSAGEPPDSQKPRPHPKMQTGSFVLSPLARLLHSKEKRRGAGFVPGTLFPDFSSWNSSSGILLAEFCCGSTRRTLSAMMAKTEQASAGPTSPPERGRAGSIQRIGQGRLVIFFALALELLLGFPEARDARCDFGAVARESFFLL